MVLLRTTKVLREAIERYTLILPEDSEDVLAQALHPLGVDSPIEHKHILALSQHLLQHDPAEKCWRLDALLRGTCIYVAPPTPKAEPTAEYRELMKRLRKAEEQKQYERMTAAPVKESFNQRVPQGFNPHLAHGIVDIPELDEVTFQDINRQLTLIINVLVTVIASGVTIWFAARYWTISARLSLALVGSFAIAVAEVVVYMGYIRRVQEAKTTEKKKVEKKQVSTTWVIEASSVDSQDREGIRHRKGKHR